MGAHGTGLRRAVRRSAGGRTAGRVPTRVDDRVDLGRLRLPRHAPGVLLLLVVPGQLVGAGLRLEAAQSEVIRAI